MNIETSRTGYFPIQECRNNQYCSEMSLRRKLPEVKIFGLQTWSTNYDPEITLAPLPQNAITLLNEPCPFWPGKKIYETHILVGMPKTVRGEPFTLSSWMNLLNSAIQGHKAPFSYFESTLKSQVGFTEVEASYWFIITNQMIPDSEYQPFEKQLELLNNAPEYSETTMLEMLTTNCLYFNETGQMLLSLSPPVYARCKEKIGPHHVMMGGFDNGVGLHPFGIEHNSSGIFAFRKLS